jgi:sortase A
LARRRYADELTTEELRRLLVERRRAERSTRLEHFRRTGRIVSVEPQPVERPLESLRSDEQPLEDEAESNPMERRKTKTRRGLDRVLLTVEMIAVLGLVFVLFNGFSLLQSLNREVSSALQQPTLTPTPLISAVVLPSGHTPPNAPGGVQFNDAEIPAHLRPLVQSLANLPVPTPSPEQAVRIQIPAIGVDAPVVMGDGWEQLKKGVGQHTGSPDPGQKGNIVLSAHNDVFGEIFRDLDKLKNGDEIILFTSARTYTYIARQTQIVEPTQVEAMAPSQEPVLTLISCYPYLVDKQRIVVTTHLQE